MEPGGGIRPEQNGLSDAAVYCRLRIPEVAGSNPLPGIMLIGGYKDATPVSKRK